MIHIIEVDTGLRVAWDDVAGTVDVLQEADDRWSDPLDPSWLHLLPQAQAGDLPLIVELTERYVLENPLHDAADMMRLLIGATAASLSLPPELEGIEPTPYVRVRQQRGVV